MSAAKRPCPDCGRLFAGPLGVWMHRMRVHKDIVEATRLTARSTINELVVRTDWMERANCKGVDTQAFYPSDGDFAVEAIRACLGCDVRAECLDYALVNNEQGIWGGTSQRERARMRRGVA